MSGSPRRGDNPVRAAVRASGHLTSLLACAVVIACDGAAAPMNGNMAFGDAPAGGRLAPAQAQRAEAIYADTCSGCHGLDLEGGLGPALAGVGQRLSASKIARIAERGKGRNKPTPMPGGLVGADDARLLSAWLTGDPAAGQTGPTADLGQSATGGSRSGA